MKNKKENSDKIETDTSNLSSMFQDFSIGEFTELFQQRNVLFEHLIKNKRVFTNDFIYYSSHLQPFNHEDKSGFGVSAFASICINYMKETTKEIEE